MERPKPWRIDPASEVAGAADFSFIRYAQCWEDTDVLLEALALKRGAVCFSVGSGGDNSLALLSRAPARVLAVDLSPAQIALIELKAAAFCALRYDELMELMGLRDSPRRGELYDTVRPALSAPARRYWDRRRALVARGISGAGKFERYFTLFRRFVLPLVHTRAEVDALFAVRSVAGRRKFYAERWNNLRWRALFRLFFSRIAMGRLGRDPQFFRYVQGPVAARVLERTEHALTELDPSANAYLHWIVYGHFGAVLPYVWRPENFEHIRRNIDRLELQVASVEASLGHAAGSTFDAFNMSDVFEYISQQASDAVFGDIARSARAGARVAYWNMMAPRSRPAFLAARLRPLEDESARLHGMAQTFFYAAFQVDEAMSQ